MLPNRHIEDPNSFMAWVIYNYPEMTGKGFDEELAIKLVLNVYKEESKLFDYWMDHLSDTPRERLGYIDYLIVKMALYELYNKVPFQIVLDQYVNIADQFSTRQCVDYLVAILNKINNEKE